LTDRPDGQLIGTKNGGAVNGGRVDDGSIREDGMSAFFDAHREVLERAVAAAAERGYWSAYPEMPSGKIYGETAKADADAAFAAMLGQAFQLSGHPADGGTVGAEASPFGRDLAIRYPAAKPATLVAASEKAGEAWARASVEDRVGVCLEILQRVNRQSFLMALAVQHTSGQAFPMAFQAGGPHAQDRGLEAVAYAFQEMSRIPGAVTWTKPQGKNDPIVLDKVYRIVPRGVALVIGCATFPTWNGYPGLFASLATGNTVIVKPHPAAILPLALTIRIGREVLAEAGYPADVLLLAADSAEAPVTKELVTDPAVAIIDFTGSPTFGRWVRENAAGKQVYTEEAGVNPVVIDSVADMRAALGNLAFSLSLYSGQMCTTPQNIFIPKDGVGTPEGRKSFDEVAQGLATAIDKLLGDPERAAGICGAIQNEATLARVEAARKLGAVVRDSADIAGQEGARTATPLLVAVNASDEHAYLEERFGPITFLVRCDSTQDALMRASTSARCRGAITAALYSTDEDVIVRAADLFAKAGVALSVNLTGGIFVNQSAAFSDYHVTGANPSGNACLTDAAFVANRFRVATMRRPKAA
jgi:phenylacetic acid degradation protein paaN